MKLASWMSLTVFVFCFSAFAQKEVVAIVGNKKITLEDFNKKFSEVKSQTQNPPSKQQFLEDMVRYEVGLQEAEKKGLEKDPIVQDRMRQELYKALLEKELSKKIEAIQVSEAEMQAWYKNNPEVRLSHILVDLKSGATAEQRAEAKKRAEEIYDKEVKGSKRPFEELVKLFSDDPYSKPTGGDMGWQSRLVLPPSLYDAAINTKPGDIRGVIETSLGFHIIKVTGKRTYEQSNKRQIRAAVFEEKRRAEFNEYFNKVKKQYTIKTNPSLLQ